LLISQIFLLTQIITFEPETPAGHPKYQKAQDCSLVSNQNFSDILPSNGWRPGPGKVIFICQNATWSNTWFKIWSYFSGQKFRTTI